MRFKIIEINVRKAFSLSGLPDIDYALNPYLGCSHGCLYCYAKMYTNIKNVADNWGHIVVVKKNIIDVISREVRFVSGKVIGIGTITDPYQPVEALYKLTRKCIEILARNRARVSIQTKSPLILRDLDILKIYRDYIDIGITITSTRNISPITEFEPFSPPPSARIYTLRKLFTEGLKTWIFYGPIIPRYNDGIDEAVDILRLAKETNSVVYIDRLRVKRFMWFDEKLKSIVRESIRYHWDEFLDKLLSLCRSMGLICREGFGYIGENKKLDKYVEN